MGEKLKTSFYPHEGGTEVKRGIYEGFALTLIELLQEGWIELPPLIKAHKDSIILALQGQNKDLRRHCRHLMVHFQRLIDLQNKGRIIDKWRNEQIKHFSIVSHSLFFFLSLSDLAMKEKRHGNI